METGNYEFAELSSDLVKEIQSLENRLKTESGEAITLIAYTQDRDRNRSGGCRPGLDD